MQLLLKKSFDLILSILEILLITCLIRNYVNLKTTSIASL